MSSRQPLRRRRRKAPETQRLTRANNGINSRLGIMMDTTRKPTMDELLLRCFGVEVIASYECRPCCVRLKDETARQRAMSTSELSAVGSVLFVSLTLRIMNSSGYATKFKNLEEFECSNEITLMGQCFVLQAVIYHLGEFADGGHFVCVRRNGTTWCEYDDRHPARRVEAPHWTRGRMPCMAAYVRRDYAASSPRPPPRATTSAERPVDSR